MAEAFTIETFSSHVGTKFLMRDGESRGPELELLSVTDVGSSPRQRQFSLVFLGPRTAPAAQGIFRLEHASLGLLELFLVPISRDETGLSYEAIFNYVLTPANATAE